jgi:hypothetical protein
MQTKTVFPLFFIHAALCSADRHNFHNANDAKAPKRSCLNALIKSAAAIEFRASPRPSFPFIFHALESRFFIQPETRDAESLPLINRN